MWKIGFNLMLCLLLVMCVYGKNFNRKQTCESNNLIYSSDGDIKIGLLINVDCSNNNNNNNSSDKSRVNTYVNAAIFTKDRINTLEYTKPFTFGLSIYEICNERDYYKSVFELFKQKDERFLLGVINLMPLSKKISEFCNVLDIQIKYANVYWLPLIKSAIKLLNKLNWKENITIVSSNRNVIQEFHRYTRREWMCVKKALILDNNLNLFDIEGPAVIFGSSEQLNYVANNLINEQEIEEEDFIFVPFDGTIPDVLPNSSYVIEPTLHDSTFFYSKPTNFEYSPIFFDVSNPMLSFTKGISKFILDNCNDTLYKYNCLSQNLGSHLKDNCGELNPIEIMQELKLDNENKFNYNIFKVENSRKDSLRLYYTYNMFNDEITIADNNIYDNINEMNFTNNNNRLCSKYLEKCLTECVNFKMPIVTKGFYLPSFYNNVRVRSESWIFAFLSISFLGCLFSLSILIYIIIRLCKKDTFEGNPIMTIFLLVTVICMYCSVIPYALEGNKITRNSICIARILTLTLTFSFAFALILSRCILLATISKEIGFMSHVSGSVQSFLCLFIFGIQCALSLQVINHCIEIFRGYTMILLLAYNIILILLLVCISPLIMKSQRNYKEGKYLTIAILLIACSWCCWLPAYAFLDYDLRDLFLCLGLVTTASIFLGALFIPRTYLLTIAIARDRLTSALPSLGTANSTLDMYRSNTQPVYDCVNIAAINAANAAKNNINIVPPPPPPQPDLYSCATLPEEDDFEIHNCDSPSRDKITRF